MTCTTPCLPGFESILAASPAPVNSAATTRRRGRSGPRGVLYTVSTEESALGPWVHREISAQVWPNGRGQRVARIRMQANASDRIGYSFGMVTVTDTNGTPVCIGMDKEQMRSVGAALLAAANSARAKWRK